MSDSIMRNDEFSRWRAFFWPVHQHELKKLLPMLALFFLVSLDYNILRTMKDTLVVTAKSSGAEVIPFIKVWVMFPSAILMTFIFTRLSNRFARETVFYLMLSIFLAFFAIFTFILYPARDLLHPHATADALQAYLATGWKGPIALFRNWTFTSFYVMAELWSSVILSLLFWGFANQITRIGEAKRFYGLFGIGANLSGVAAGQLSAFFCCLAYNPSLPFGSDAWEQSMIMLVSLIIVVGVGIIAVFRWLNTRVLTDSLYNDNASQGETHEAAGKVKGKLSMRASIAFLFRSKYLICLALIVVSYNLVINLVEVVWKHQVKELYPTPSAFNFYMSEVATITGIIATLAALLISGNSIRKCGWTFTAMLTPAIIFITSIGFFGFFFLKEYQSDAALAILGTAPLTLVVFFGSAQNILSRGAKYSVFDATKEMAFVPLNAESQIKGKAVIDGVCSRMGKSGGSLVHQTLLLSLSSITASAPYVAAFLLGIIGLWLVATHLLGKKFTELTTPPEAVLASRTQEKPFIPQAALAEG